MCVRTCVRMEAFGAKSLGGIWGSVCFVFLGLQVVNSLAISTFKRL